METDLPSGMLLFKAKNDIFVEDKQNLIRYEERR